jgi:hypothetical protein
MVKVTHVGTEWHCFVMRFELSQALVLTVSLTAESVSASRREAVSIATSIARIKRMRGVVAHCPVIAAAVGQKYKARPMLRLVVS